ncbi:MAG: VWA domain-containing protein [bacterium]|nr:VWA domain-containing protein [bacterium]
MAEVNLSTSLGYQAVMTTSENKLAYLLAEVKPGDEVGLGPVNLNLAIVLDKSGSMYAAQKLDFVIQAVKQAVDMLRPNDLCSIVIFAERARVLIPSSQIYDKGTTKVMIDKIDHVDVGSGTNMLRAVDAALYEVRRNFSRDRLNHIIVLTDGQTLCERECYERCVMAAEEGISVSTIGVGDDFNEQFLLKIANSCRGTSYYIDEPRDIQEIFTRELAGVQNVVLKNCRLNLKLCKDVVVRHAYKVKPLINDLGAPEVVDRFCSIELADLQKGETQSVLYELLLPSRRSGVYRIATSSMSYEIPGRGVCDNMAPQEVTITYTDDPSQASIVTPKVLQIVDSVSIFRQQTRALQLAQEGDRGKATQLLRSAATQLLQQGQKELADQALSEASRIENGSRTTSAGTKKLEYGTRKLTQLLSEVPGFPQPVSLQKN